jgi:hypothetical protein
MCQFVLETEHVSACSDGIKSEVLQGKDGVVGDPYTYAVFMPAGLDPHHSLLESADAPSILMWP